MINRTFHIFWHCLSNQCVLEHTSITAPFQVVQSHVWLAGAALDSKVLSSEAGFCNLTTLNILRQLIPCYGDCPTHCRMLRSISGLFPIDAHSTPSCDKQTCLQAVLSVPW